VYLVGLQNRDYNFLLLDFGYYQFDWRGTRDSCEVRYAYYPNPFEVMSFEDYCAQEPSTESTSGTLEDYMQALGDAETNQQHPLIRYEVDESRYVELRHPAAHMHFSVCGEDRWPVERVLTPHSFVLLISKMFYFERWKAAQSSQKEDYDMIYCREKGRCPKVGADRFTATERTQLFFT
jgi:hypothetical protein